MLPLLAVPFGAEVAADARRPTPSTRSSGAPASTTSSSTSSMPCSRGRCSWWWKTSTGSTRPPANCSTISSSPRRSRPWAGVLTRRPEGAWQPVDDPDQVADHVTDCDLDPLTDDDIRSIAIQVSERPLSDAELDDHRRSIGRQPAVHDRTEPRARARHHRRTPRVDRRPDLDEDRRAAGPPTPPAARRCRVRTRVRPAARVGRRRRRPDRDRGARRTDRTRP